MSPMQKEIYTRTVAEVKAEVAEAYEDRPEQQAGISCARCDSAPTPGMVR